MTRVLWTLTALLLAVSLGFSAHRPERDLPPIVSHYFEMQWPLARITGVDHTTERGADYYDVVARNYGQRLDVVFKEDGDVMVVRESVPTRDVSSFVRGGVRQAYPGAKILKATKVTLWSNITWDVVIRDRDHRRHSLAVAFDGRVIGTTG